MEKYKFSLRRLCLRLQIKITVGKTLCPSRQRQKPNKCDCANGGDFRTKKKKKKKKPDEHFSVWCSVKLRIDDAVAEERAEWILDPLPRRALARRAYDTTR